MDSIVSRLLRMLLVFFVPLMVASQAQASSYTDKCYLTGSEMAFKFTPVLNYNNAKNGAVIATGTAEVHVVCAARYEITPGHRWELRYYAHESPGDNWNGACNTTTPGVGIRILDVNGSSVPCFNYPGTLVSIDMKDLPSDNGSQDFMKVVKAELVKTGYADVAPGAYNIQFESGTFERGMEPWGFAPYSYRASVSSSSPPLKVTAICSSTDLNETVDFGRAKPGDKKRFGIYFRGCNLDGDIASRVLFTLVGGTAGTNRLPMRSGTDVAKGVAIDIKPSQGDAVKFGTKYEPVPDTLAEAETSFLFDTELVETGEGVHSGRIDATMTIKVEHL